MAAPEPDDATLLAAVAAGERDALAQLLDLAAAVLDATPYSRGRSG